MFYIRTLFEKKYTILKLKKNFEHINQIHTKLQIYSYYLYYFYFKRFLFSENTSIKPMTFQLIVQIRINSLKQLRFITVV